MKKKAIGIIGGMGPAATVDLFGKIVNNTAAGCDAEHIRVYVDCHAAIPDRTKAILAGGESPLPCLTESAKKLASVGADFLIMPCNTAHYFYNDLCAVSPVPVMSMIEETAKYIKNHGMQRVGLLATSGTVQSGVYHTQLSAYGIETLCPGAEGQQAVMSFIYDGVKADAAHFPIDAMKGVMNELFEQGAEALILGCTELPLGFERYGLSRKNTIDTVLVLARAAVVAAGYPMK